MPQTDSLRLLFQDFQVSGKFEKNEIKAVLSILIEMADRLEAVERVCKIQRPG